MLKILKSDKDTYITDKVVKGKRKVNSNVGYAGTLDLFKLYGATMSGSTPNRELSRILIHFDLNPIKTLVSSSKIDINDPSFFCKLNLKDVYGGQPTPTNFTVSVFPLSSSFDEGIGKNVTYYSDYDISNWLTSSLSGKWFVSGCGLACFSTGTGDYITSSTSVASTEVTQNFLSGQEDLTVDVTKIVSATLSGEIPDSGFRISFKNELEDNTKSYFVKRFGSRNAYDVTKHPTLVVGFDDSITDDTKNLVFDESCSIKLYNYSAGSLKNIVSGSSLSQVSGSNCLLLRLETPISGGTYVYQVTGSQHSFGSNYAEGIYSASVTLLSSDASIAKKISQSGSIEFTPIWSSLDGSISYVTGSTLTFRSQTRGGDRKIKKYVLSISGLKSHYRTDEEPLVRLNIFDETNPNIFLTRLPVEAPNSVINDAFYQIRDVTTNEVLVPFDEQKRSTKISSDSSGMFFKFDTSNLRPGSAYVIDVLLSTNGVKEKFMNVSSNFTMENVTTTS